MRWKDDTGRAALLSLYAEADALVRASTCACSSAPGDADGRPREDIAPCCRFAVTGREPYPTAVELAEVEHAIRARGVRRLPLVADDLRTCPLLSTAGRCTIYESRPLGCRTYFCERGEGPPKHARAALLEVARRVADLSARTFPRDPRPRPLLGALKRMI